MTKDGIQRIFPPMLTYTRERLVNEITRCLRECDLSLRAFALKAGVTYDNMKDFMWGRTQMLKGENLQKVAAVLEKDATNVKTGLRVPIVGTVGAGSRVFPINDLPLLPRKTDPAEQDEINCDWVDAPPGVYPNGVVALRVTGPSMMPFMPPGTIVYYANRYEGGAPDDCIAKLCVVETRDGASLLKMVRKSHFHGKFDLVSYNHDTIADVELAWCAPVIFIKPI